jgi:hypothetical protein
MKSGALRLQGLQYGSGRPYHFPPVFCLKLYIYISIYSFFPCKQLQSCRFCLLLLLLLLLLFVIGFWAVKFERKYIIDSHIIIIIIRCATSLIIMRRTCMSMYRMRHEERYEIISY